MKSFYLGSRKIGQSHTPYIIAEIGVNHECSIYKAKKLILKAKKGGADAAKFQTYKADLITTKQSPSYWNTKKEKNQNQYKLFKKYDHFTISDYKKLQIYCKKIKIDFASTPFDLDAVDALNNFVSYFKIASADITNYPLIKRIASKKKTVLLSTGASNISEITNAVRILQKYGCKKIVIMHCILNYPTLNRDANLGMIIDLQKKFPNNIIGYSDHTLPDKEMLNLTTSYILGARVIEKHFTLSKKKKGNDHYHSMDIKDLKNLKKRFLKIKEILGVSKKVFIKSEIKSRKFARRSLVLIRDKKKNEVLKKNDIICKRPGTGISPVFFNNVIGKKLKKNLNYDHILKFKDLV